MKKKTLKIVEATLKGKIVKNNIFNLKTNVSDEEAINLFNLIAPMINTNNQGNYVTDTFVYYEISTCLEDKTLQTFLPITE